MECKKCNKEIDFENADHALGLYKYQDDEKLDVRIECNHCGTGHYTFIDVEDMLAED